MKVTEIMVSPVHTVRTDTPIRAAAMFLADHSITSLPVLDQDDRIVGIVSEIDLIRDRMPHDPRSHLRPEPHEQPDPAQHVGQVMTDTVVCLGGFADVADAAALMLDNNVRAVPIVDGARLIGIVSRRDLLRSLLRDDASIAREITERLTDYGGEPTRWRVTVVDGVGTIRGPFENGGQEAIVTVLARTVPGVLRVHTKHGATITTSAAR